MLAGLVRPALAADDEAEQARVHLRRAAAAADLGNYTEAAKEYEAAYIKTSDGNLLAQVGQAWQAAGDRGKALTAFRSCVRLAPDGTQRGLCDARARELEYSSAIPASAPPAMPGQAPMGVMPLATPTPAPPPLPPPYVAQPLPATTVVTCEPYTKAAADPIPAYQAMSFWIVLGALIVAGAVVGVVYLQKDNDLAMPTTTFGTKSF
jgi:tetratricopeptide (TPR) repeat protein